MSLLTWIALHSATYDHNQFVQEMFEETEDDFSDIENQMNKSITSKDNTVSVALSDYHSYAATSRRNDLFLNFIF